jgi:signal transduction protein with GAF and PtsI domain
MQNILGDLSRMAWYSNAYKFGYNALIVIPLLKERGPLGILVIYASEPEAFVDPEIENLKVLSEKISQKLVLGWKDIER